MIKKIYVCIPGNLVTGGPETLHQFVHEALKYYDETYVYYYGNGGNFEIPKKYEKYHVKMTSEIEDTPDNMIIVPEIAINLLSDYFNIRKCVWWLSLDNYYVLNRRYKHMQRAEGKSKLQKCFLYTKYFLITLYRLVSGQFYTIKKLGGDVFHLYNCEYVRRFLVEKGVDENRMLYLCGPLERQYFEPIDLQDTLSRKENIVAYNYSKGLDYVKLLEKENTNGYLFVPIKDMTTEEVRELLLKSKVYVDFGYFPGPERIPRQAAMCYCSILTSTSGSAANEVDIPIPVSNKIDLKHFDAKKAYKRVEELMDGFEDDVCLYDNYRNKVKQQEADFEKNVRMFIQEIIQGN